MDAKQKAWEITMALVAKGDVSIDLDNYSKSIELIEAIADGFQEAYEDRSQLESVKAMESLTRR
ncbi:hypothetical protein AABC73_06940 [Pseudomonas sp. G.S.17]|uniref:hypothetical protein n=1 Tax=Pseudomonas sp. G.S.17 TaxID=3137451 RepID=UPI00311CA641